MADRWSVFHAAVKHSLDGWPALHIAQQQGFGGNNFREKIDWLLDVIVQIFKDNGHVYPDELEEYLSECMFNEFDIIVDDGTCPKVVEKICNFSQLCESGQFSKVLDQLRVPPPTFPSVSVAAASHDASDDDVQEDEKATETGTDNNCTENQENTESMDVDDAPQMDGGDNDGWEVVKRSKQRNSHNKPR
eukprot:gene562-10249_t